MTTTFDPFAPISAALTRPCAQSSDFDLNPDKDRPKPRRLRDAGVLVGILQTGRGPEVILTKRSSALKHHPGQIAFPGGKVDPSDTDPVAAALREAREEIGLDPANTQLLGTLPTHETVTGFLITPVVVRVIDGFDPRPEPGEVQDVFRVPLHHLLGVHNYQVQSRRWAGTDRHYYAVPYGPYYIWGATARILRGFAERMAQ